MSISLKSLIGEDPLGELGIFVLKELQSCIFPLLFFGLLLVSHFFTLGMPRYDFIFVGAMAIQIMLLVLRIETRDEALVLTIFHILGLALELFKTQPGIGSWSYPESSYLRIATVPLYSGFMYASVASYICQAWRRFDLKILNYPSYWFSVPLSTAIYLNFFTHHFIGDFRWWLMLIVLIVFWRTTVQFTTKAHRTRKMPLVLSFVLIGFFIWVAENISTLLGAWSYPDQLHSWTWVASGKITSWFLLVIISFLIVADLKHVKTGQKQLQDKQVD
jgi:uncharacterized membrane protein YoaT (DUF817 family)